MGFRIFELNKIISLGMLALVASQISACRFADEKKMMAKYGKTKIVTEHVEIANEEYVLSHRIDPTGEFNQFELVLEFNPAKYERLEVKYQIDENVESDWIKIPIEQMSFRLAFPGGHTVKIKVKKLDSDLDTPIFEATIPVAEDYVFDKSKTLDKDFTGNFSHITIKENVIIQTDGYKFDIVAKELTAEDQATIQTFGLSARAAHGTDGRHGGKISIIASKAVGSLTIRGFGENGGHGENGKDHSPLRAKDGANGADAKEKCLPMTPVCTCESNAKSGENGKPGLPAKNGERAGNGGNSAKVTVAIDNDSDFDLSVSLKEGTAGNPGKPGAAQFGGFGGNRGRGKPSCNNPGENGKPGSPGAVGSSGNPGSDGSVIKSCIKIAGKVENCPSGELGLIEKLSKDLSTEGNQ